MRAEIRRSVWVWALLTLTLSASAQTPIALVDGVPITEDEILAAAAGDLEDLENERLQFEAEARSREHQIIAGTLEQMIIDRLLDAESEKRGVSRDQLLDLEVWARVPEPTVAEIESVYQANLQQLIALPREEAIGRVTQFLNQRNYDSALAVYIDGLKEEYSVEERLEPYRVAVETEGYPAHGPENAPITLIEFSDFECPFCRQTQPVLDQIETRFEDSIRFVFRQFPLTDIHPRAQKAAEASLCAGDQGEFWPMHDLLFAEPIELEVASLKFKADSLGLDRDVFDSCLDSSKYASRVDEEIRDGILAGVSATPTIFINGRQLTGALPYEEYVAIIEEELERASD
jgi:protein-disulfide isomerase